MALVSPPSKYTSSAFTTSIVNIGRFCRFHALSSQLQDDNKEESLMPENPLIMHHTAIRTRNITTAIQFYSLLGFETTAKFRAGPARAAWLEQKGEGSHGSRGSSRLELIEIPSYILNEPEGMKKRALDLAARQDLLGQNHFALDVTSCIEDDDELETLADWIDILNKKSIKQFGKNLRIAVEPVQRLIGKSVYELAFLYDADGALVELLRKQTDLKQDMSSGWEPWDGKGFSGGL